MTMRRVTLAGLVALLAVSAAGCWRMPGFDLNRSAYNSGEDKLGAATVPNLQKIWTVDTGSGAPVRWPIVSDKVVHVSTANKLVSYDLAGSYKWEWTVANATGGVVMGPALYDGKVVWAGGGDPDGATDGATWSNQQLDPATGNPLGMPSGTGRGFVDSVNLDYSLLRESASVCGTPPCTPWGARFTIHSLKTQPTWAGLIHLGGKVPVSGLTMSTKFVYAAVGGDIDGTSYLRGWNIASPGGMCLPPTQDQCPNWSTSLSGNSAASPVLDPPNNALYTGTDTGFFYAIDATTGTVRWSMKLASGITDSPALANGKLYIPTASSGLVVLNTNGRTVFTALPGTGIKVQPAVANAKDPVVFVGTSDGRVRAYDADGCGASTCSSIWSSDLGSEITGAPAVSDSRLLVGTKDGRLIAYALPAGS